MKIETARRLFLTQAEWNILEKALDLCNQIDSKSEGSENWISDVINASAAIDDLLGQVEEREEN